MPLIYVFLVLIAIGVILWLVNTYIPMAGSIKTIINVVAVVLVIIWLLKVFGLWGGMTNIRAEEYKSFPASYACVFKI